MPDHDRNTQPAAASAGERPLNPAEVMVYLNVLDRFETPAYEGAWRYFRQTAQACPRLRELPRTLPAVERDLR